MKITTTILLFLLTVSLSQEVVSRFSVIEGNIYFEDTKEPVVNAFVYIVEGEEEYLTDKKGYFKITTWQKLPVQLTVKYHDQPPFKTTISDASKKQIIWIKNK